MDIGNGAENEEMQKRVHKKKVEKKSDAKEGSKWGSLETKWMRNDQKRSAG